MAQQECRKGNGKSVRFARAWWQVHDQPLDLTAAASLKLAGHHLEMPTWAIFCSWVQLKETALNEGTWILPQHRIVFIDREVIDFQNHRGLLCCFLYFERVAECAA